MGNDDPRRGVLLFQWFPGKIALKNQMFAWEDTINLLEMCGKEKAHTAQFIQDTLAVH